MSLTIVENEAEIFTRSTCNCEFCVSTHQAVNRWDTYVPVTLLQKNMKNVVAKIENGSGKQIKKRKSS